MKEKILKGRNLKRLLSVVLALAMILTLLPLNSMTVYAESATYLTFTAEEANSTIKFNYKNGIFQYSTKSSGGTWSDFTSYDKTSTGSSGIITLTNVGDQVRFKGNMHKRVS